MERPLSQSDVESQILDLSERLSEATHEYRDLCESVAQAEMDFKHSFHTAVIVLASGPKTTADVRKSNAWLRSERQERDFTIRAATKEGSREYLRSLTTRIEALRTISANVRGQT